MIYVVWYKQSHKDFSVPHEVTAERPQRLSTAEKKGFVYQELFDLKTTPDTTTKYRKLFDGQYVSTIELDGRKFLKIDPEGLRKLSQQP